jgi:hypothetical protein
MRLTCIGGPDADETCASGAGARVQKYSGISKGRHTSDPPPKYGAVP